MAINTSSAVRALRLFRDERLTPQAQADRLARTAVEVRERAIAAGIVSGTYTTTVDGREGASEASVQPNGQIVYRWPLLQKATDFALRYCLIRSPQESGDYLRGWFVAVNGNRFRGEIKDIPADAEVMICNFMPYHRKIDLGWAKMTAHSNIVEDARQAVQRVFPTIDASRIFASLTANIGAPPDVKVPYILQGHSRSIAKKYTARKIKAGTRTVAAPRKDTAKGEVMTYPALVLKVRR